MGVCLCAESEIYRDPTLPFSASPLSEPPAEPHCSGSQLYLPIPKRNVSANTADTSAKDDSDGSTVASTPSTTTPSCMFADDSPTTRYFDGPPSLPAASETQNQCADNFSNSAYTNPMSSMRAWQPAACGWLPCETYPPVAPIVAGTAVPAASCVSMPPQPVAVMMFPIDFQGGNMLGQVAVGDAAVGHVAAPVVCTTHAAETCLLFYGNWDA